MNSKLTRTILLASGIGFFVLWVLEFRRAGLLESYWLLLVSLVCLLFFQFNRLKAATAQSANEKEIEVNKAAASKKNKK
ncbi:hypothetical protein [Dyadobacter sp. 32]|uniref:hypothetical protein n=1 Tax=Dyadobacter sp. 32 TaxID=538966 RepID=UPI0011EFEC1C